MWWLPLGLAGSLWVPASGAVSNHAAYGYFVPQPVTHEEAPQRSDGPQGFLNDIAFFARGEEHDEWTLELDEEAFILDEVDIEDVERGQAGLRYRGGPEFGGVVVHIFVERVEFEDSPFSDEIDLLGLEFGIEGAPRFLRQKPVSPLVDYSLLVSLHAGEGDDIFDEFGFLEANARLGLGVDIVGLQIAAGGTFVGVAGAYDFNQTVRSGTITGDADAEAFSGFNAGGYARLSYRARDFPVVAHVQGIVGKLTGFFASIGIRF